MKQVPLLAICGCSLLFIMLIAVRSAWSHPPVLPPPVPQPLVEIDVLVDGRPLPKYRHGDVGYLSVPRIGCEYVIRIRNHDRHRIEAVLSVDGLSAINGSRASEHIRGYLVPAGGSVEIPGWRRGDRRVAAFTFTNYENSYAYRTGRADGIGSIKLVAFSERHDYPHSHRSVTGRELDRVASPTTASRDHSPDHRSPNHPDRIGTGYGDEIDHRVARVPFERSSVRRCVTFRYGHHPLPWPTVTHHEEDAQGEIFTPRPPGYRG